MEINLENFKIRRSEPLIAGKQGLPEGNERYIAKGGGIIGLDIFAGDEIYINNIEGMQECELACFDNKGSDNLNIICLKNNSNANYIKNILSNNSEHKFLLSKLNKKNINFHNAVSYNFFKNNSYAGEVKELNVIENGFIILAVPGKILPRPAAVGKR